MGKACIACTLRESSIACTIRKTSISVSRCGVVSSHSVRKLSSTLPPLNRGFSNQSKFSSFCCFNSSKMSSLSLSYLWGVYWSDGKVWVESWSNKGLWVESRGCWKTRVSYSESIIINVLNLLKLSIGVNIRILSSDSSICVSNFLLGRVDVCIAVVEVSKLILSMELRPGTVLGSQWSRSGSSIGGQHRCSSIGISWGISIGDGLCRSICHGRGNNFLSLNLCWSSHGIRISSIWKTSIWIASICLTCVLVASIASIWVSTICLTGILVASIASIISMGRVAPM